MQCTNENNTANKINIFVPADDINIKKIAIGNKYTSAFFN